MPDIDGLQVEYDELTRTIEHLNQLRNSGSDDYDWNDLDRAINRRNEVRRTIEDAGGTPGGDLPQTDSPPGGQGGSTGASPTPPTLSDLSASTIGQLERELEQLRDNPPHPGVRLEDGKVVGGTAEELEQQIEWRGRVERLDHELTAAQADEAWAQNGGPGGFTDTEISAIERAGEEIDAIQERLDAVNRQIAEKNAQLDEAQGFFDSQTTQGGGPNAAGGAAIAIAARINGELRVLHQHQAAISQELTAALEALAGIVRARVRSQLEASGIKVGLPTDRIGTAAVEDAFLRRVYRRLGLPYLQKGASGILGNLTGTQSRLPSKRTGLLVLAAVVVLVGFGTLASGLLGGGDTAAPVVAISDSGDAQPADDSNGAVDETPVDDNTGAVDETSVDETSVDDNDGLVLDEVAVAGPEDVVVAVDPEPLITLPPMATGIGIPYGCAEVVHVPLAGFADSLSFFHLGVLVGGFDGPIPEGTVLTIDAGGLAPNSGPVNGHAAEVSIPIDHFGTYSLRSITAVGPDGAIPVTFAIDDIRVGSAEGSVGGCVTPSEALDRRPDWLFPGVDDATGELLWFGDTPPTPAGSSSDEVVASGTPDFQPFLDGFGAAHNTNDVDALLGWLDAATLDRYGSSQCRQYLDQVAGSFADATLLDAAAEPWDYLTDGITTHIPDAWTLQIDVFLGGDEVQVPMHISHVDGQISWFTDCGEPDG